MLLILALSAVCIYAPCRWNYRRISPPAEVPVRRYLSYLYLTFYATLPIQLFKNYRYYQYIQEHGGYLQFWVNSRRYRHQRSISCPGSRAYQFPGLPRNLCC